MAIIKDLELDNGITVNYHRIGSVRNTTNVDTRIEVVSYISKSDRESEREHLENGTPMAIYNHTNYITIDYDPTMTTARAYQYLYSLDQFEDGEED